VNPNGCKSANGGQVSGFGFASFDELCGIGTGWAAGNRHLQYLWTQP
jgi:hypothetical protein